MVARKSSEINTFSSEAPVSIDDLWNEATKRTPIHTNGSQPAQQATIPPTFQAIHRLTFGDLTSALRKRARQNYDEKFTVECLNAGEHGDAQLLHSVLSGAMIYDHAERIWYWYNGCFWEPDRTGSILNLSSVILSELYKKLSVDLYSRSIDLQARIRASADGVDQSVRDELEKVNQIVKRAGARSAQLHDVRAVNNALDFAKRGVLLGITGNEWDTKTHLLGVANGVIDLTTGQPVQPSPDQYIRTVAPVGFDPGATCPLFDRALLEIFDGDRAKADFVQRSVGYAMTGECSESYFNIWYGKHGRNGKEFILERVKAALGDRLSGIVEAELLLKSKNAHTANAPTEALMVLRGRRVAWSSENDEGRTFSTANMKQLSGGHSITGRHNHTGQVEWRRTHTLFFLTNYLPHVPSQELAEWDRIRVLTFPLSFVDNPDPVQPWQRKKDATLDKQIDTNELPGILNWLIAGALAWRSDGLAIPSSVMADTAAYRADEDTLGHFIRECCEIDKDARAIARGISPIMVRTIELFRSYKLWFENSCNGKAMGKKIFYGKIRERGFSVAERYVDRSQSEHFIGIRLRSI